MLRIFLEKLETFNIFREVQKDSILSGKDKEQKRKQT